MLFFTKNTRFCHKLKLFKLLYFLDFEIYRVTGRTTTGLDYFAWKMGPVPKRLYEELDDPKPDMKTALLITKARDRDTDFETDRLDFKPRRPFNDEWFTLRELEVMGKLSEIYRDATGFQISEVSHLRGEPWHKIFKVNNTPQALIPYALALDPEKSDSITIEQAELIAEEERELHALFG